MDSLMKETNIFYNVFCFLLTENEKFIDKTNSQLYWRTVYHTLAFFHHCYVGLFAIGIQLDGYAEVEIRTLKKYRSGFLTGWNFMFQTTFLFISVCYDTLEWVNKHDGRVGRLIKYWRDIIFSAFVVPITLFVTGMFWSVYSIDRELVFPQVYDQIVPWWFNHCVHTNIVIVVAIETLLVARRKPVNVVLETWIVAAVTVLYAVVYYSIYFFAHRWLYGVFGVMTWWQVCLFQCFIWAISYVFYRIQYPINRLFHGDDEIKVDELDHGVKTIGRINGNLGDKIKNDVEITKVDMTKVDELDHGVKHIGSINGNVGDESKNDVEITKVDNSVVENGLIVNGVGVNNNSLVDSDVDDSKGVDFNAGFKFDEMKRRNSNSPIFTDRSWSKKYNSLRGQFEKTKL